MSELLYFAYGSNLHPHRLRERIGRTTVVSVGTLRGARLSFDKIGRDGSGKCNVSSTGDTSAMVLGAVYRVTSPQVRSLDRFESLGRGYERLTVSVELSGGARPRCLTYVAMPEFVDERLAPFDWYKELVCLGAERFAFPRGYVAELRRQPAVRDPDPRRVEERRLLLARMREPAGRPGESH